MSKKLLVTGLVLLLVAASILGYFEYAKRQPRYSLSKLIAACQTRDVATFRHYVNLDAIVSNTVDGLKRSMGANMPRSGGGEMEQLGAALQEGMMRVIVPGIAKQVSAGVEQAVVQGKLAYLHLCGSGLRSDASCNVSVDSVERLGDKASVAVSIQDSTEQHPVQLVLTMIRRDDSWQVVAVQNWKDLIAGAPSLLRD
jgi:hypothetical protein